LNSIDVQGFRRARLVLALGIALVVSSAALTQPALSQTLMPQAVRLHLASWHDRGDFNNANLGAALRWKSGLILGGFDNSFGRASWYGGLALPAFEIHRFQLELMAGVISGYSDSSPVDLVAVLSLGWRMSTRNTVQVVFMPRFVIPANAVHVMFERRLGGREAESVH